MCSNWSIIVVEDAEFRSTHSAHQRSAKFCALEKETDQSVGSPYDVALMTMQGMGLLGYCCSTGAVGAL